MTTGKFVPKEMFPDNLVIDEKSLPKPTIKSPAFELLDLPFAAAMCDCWQEGIKEGRSAGDWARMEWDEETRAKYIGKTMRHLYQCLSAKTPEEAKKHAAALACNANILWRHVGCKNT